MLLLRPQTLVYPGQKRRSRAHAALHPNTRMAAALVELPDLTYNMHRLHIAWLLGIAAFGAARAFLFIFPKFVI